jgi:hypothetical protein
MGLASLALATQLALLPQGPELVTPGAGLVSVPPGRVAEMLERLGDAAPVSDPGALGEPWPAWDDRSPEAWGGEPVWRRWVELVRAESGARATTPKRRAELACLAHLQ